MNFGTKLIVSIITISATIVASIWTGFETIDSRMDGKVKEGKKEVLTLVYTLRNESTSLLKAQDDKVGVQLAALHNDVGEVRKDVRTMLGIVKRSQAFVVKKPNSYYTNNETNNLRGDSI